MKNMEASLFTEIENISGCFFTTKPKNFTQLEPVITQCLNLTPPKKNIQSNLLKGNVHISLIDNSYFALINKNATDVVSFFMRNGGQYYEPTLRTIHALAGKAGTFLDLGANIGAISLGLASRGWKGYAFEMDPSNADLLCCSIALNNFDVQVIEKAVGDKSETLQYTISGPHSHINTNIHNAMCQDRGIGEASVISIDDWIKTQRIDSLDFIKMDIEGYEPKVFRGMLETLKRYNCPLIYCEIESWCLGCFGETQYTLFKIIEGLGYNAYVPHNDGLAAYDMTKAPPNEAHDVFFISDITAVNLPVYRLEPVPDYAGHIAERLSGFKQWEEVDHSRGQCFEYLCLFIKDFPYIYEDPRVNSILCEMKQLDGKWPFWESCLSWFTEDSAVEAALIEI